MKSWNGPDEHAPLVAPLRSSPAGDRVQIRRALVFTAITCMGIFGLDALFPDVKNVLSSSPSESGLHQKPFQWSQVCHTFRMSLCISDARRCLVRCSLVLYQRPGCTTATFFT